MKRSRSAVEARRMQILHMIEQADDSPVRVEDLAQHFHTSLMTIRRDLQSLNEQKLITRTFGGATASPVRAGLTAEEQLSMCRDALSRVGGGLVDDGDVIFINGSKTALGLLDYVGDKNVTVITNNTAVVAKNYPPNVKISLTGGDLRGHVMVGDYVIRNLIGISATKTFLGCVRVYSDGEFGYNIPTEIGINEVMVSRTLQNLYVMADHTKLAHYSTRGQENHYGSCRYDRPCTLITDERADPEIVADLRESGIQVIVTTLQGLGRGVL